MRTVLLSAALGLAACGLSQQAPKALPTLWDLAHNLCVLAATENPPAGLDVEQLAEDAAEAFCQSEAHVRPFYDELAGAKAAAGRRAGLVAE